MEQYYTVIYKYEGVDNELIKGMMAKSLMRVYNTYVDMCNNGITDRLNKEFEVKNPDYFTENSGKDWTEKTEYNQFMTDGYNKYVCSILNEGMASVLLEFYVDPKEVNLMGHLRWNKNATIEFYMKEV